MKTYTENVYIEKNCKINLNILYYYLKSTQLEIYFYDRSKSLLTLSGRPIHIS